MSLDNQIGKQLEKLLIRNYNHEMAKPLIKPLHKIRAKTPDGQRRINNKCVQRKKAKKAARKARRANR